MSDTSTCGKRTTVTSTTSSTAQSVDTLTSPKNVEFKVIKVSAASSYIDEIPGLKTAFPARTSINASDIKSGAFTDSFSYERIAKLLVSVSGLVTTQSSSGVAYKSQFTKYNDTWQSDTVITGVSPCGENIPINHLEVLIDTPTISDPGRSIVRFWPDWAADLFSKHPAAKTYNSSYSAGSGKQFTVIAYLMDAQGLYIRRNPLTGACDESTMDQSVVASLAADTGGVAQWVAKWPVRYAMAMQYPHNHTFPVAIFLSNVFNSSYIASTCSRNYNNLFDAVLSHEIGHQILSAGHDPRTGMWMDSVQTCQQNQTFGYTPTGLDTTEFKNGPTTVSASSVTGFTQQILYANGSTVWIP